MELLMSETISTSTAPVDVRDTVILGSGCSGLTAAIYAARSNLKPLVLEGHEPGGQLSITTLVENFPGWPEGIQGPELIENMKKQATRFGAELRMAHLNSIDLTKRPFALNIGKETIHTRTLIIASGASARWLGLPSEQALIGHGVSSCATCDGFFASGKEIAVIGGGDSAMEEALFLTRFATKVTLINRSENFRASRIMLERAIAHPQIAFLHNTVVEEVLGVEEKDVRGLKLKNVKTGVQSEIPVSFMFLGIGHTPNASAFKGILDLDDDGYILTHGNVFPTLNGQPIPGVFACGDIQDRRYRQAITAAGSGCMAALEVEKYLEDHGR
jgi:thioredoxin reductase (NADPH)